eukprot:SAG31_NODE_1609_length_7753_cov_12.390253_3_plen_85_part_00
MSFAGPSENYGEEVFAVVVPKEGAALDPEEVRAYVGTKLAPMKVPTIVFVADDVPRTATGKIQRRIVAEVYVDEIKARSAKPKL